MNVSLDRCILWVDKHHRIIIFNGGVACLGFQKSPYSPPCSCCVWACPWRSRFLWPSCCGGLIGSGKRRPNAWRKTRRNPRLSLPPECPNRSLAGSSRDAGLRNTATVRRTRIRACHAGWLDSVPKAESPSFAPRATSSKRLSPAAPDPTGSLNLVTGLVCQGWSQAVRSLVVCGLSRERGR